MKYIFVKKFYLFAVTLIISSNCICAQQAVLLSGNTPGNAEYINNPANSTSALRFKAGGHILQFGDKGMMAASTSHALRIEFVGANAVTPAGEGAPAQPVPGNQPGKPADAETQELKKVSYPNLWQGVSLTYQATPQGVYETHYTLQPDARGQVNAGAIRLRYNRDLTLDKNGNLVIAYPNGTVTESAPIAWQTINGQRRPVPVTFALRGARELGFTLGACAPGIAVEIDPTLSWNTFLGGSGTTDVAYSITIDSSGNLYVAGYCSATWGSPIRAFSGGTYDGFVAKLNADGTLAWNTFLGGSGTDYALAITLDSSGNVVVSGFSDATWGTPIMAYTNSDIFVVKLTSDGALLWNTFMGTKTVIIAVVKVCCIVVSSSGDIYVGGQSSATWGSPIRPYTSDKDGFVAKLTSSGTLVWNTFLGGTGIWDFVNGIALDSSGNIYVGGMSIATWGSPIKAFGAAAGYYDGFVAELNSSGTLLWNTFLGGGTNNRIYDITLDSSANIYVSGVSSATWGTPLNAFNSSYTMNGFVAKYTSAGTLVWNTFVGDNSMGNFTMQTVILDSNKNIYTGSGNNIYKFTSSGTLLWNTVFGSPDEIDDIVLDGNRNVYVVGSSSATWGSPVRAFTSGKDGYIAMIAQSPVVTTQAVTNITSTTATGNGTITDLGYPESVTSYGVCWSSTNATPTITDSYVDNGATTTTGAFTASMTGLTPGTTYYVRAYATNTAGTGYGGAVTFTTPAVEVWKGGVFQAGYTTLKGAFDAINAGTHTGDLVIKINASTTETATAALNYSGSGSASYTSINIYPTVSGLSISGNLAAPLIQLNGADNVTIDGRVNATGTPSSASDMLTIVNPSVTTASTIQFINGACSNTVQYCNVKGAAPTGYGIVMFSTSSVTYGATTGNYIKYNNITNSGTRPINAIYSAGTASYGNNTNYIQNNNIYDFLNASANSYGINLGANTSGWTISDNSFYETTSFAPSSPASYIGIFINNTSGTGFTVSNNYIGGSSALCAGTWTKTIAADNMFNAIYLSVGTGTPTSVQGNIIQNFSWGNSNTSSWRGIYLNAGDVNVGTTTGNTIGGTGSISYTAAATGAAVYGIYINSAGTVTCTSNIIGSITGGNAATFATNIYGIYKAAAGVTTISNNIIGSINASSGSTNAGNAQTVYGIYNTGTGAIYIIGNTIANLTNGTTNINAGTPGLINGIYSSAGTNTVSGNTIRDLTIANANTATGNTCSVGGIVFSGTGAVNTATGNTIYTLKNNYATFAGQVAGIYFTGSTGANVCNRNFIRDLLVTGSSGASVYGIKKASGAVTISNNIVTLGTGTTNSYNLYGIYETGSTATNISNLYFNTVYLDGAPTAVALPSYALYNDVTTNNRDFRNNLLVNVRSGTGAHYCIRAAGTAALTYCNYNDYYVTGTGGAVGFLTSPRANLTAWQGASLQDGNSKSVDPQFATPGGSAADNYTPAYNKLCGISGTGITTDYTTATRTYNTMGAFDVTTIYPVEVWKGGTFQTGYFTLRDAFAAINAGTHTGDLVIKINDNTTETATAVLNYSGSASASYTSINIYPTVSGLTVSSPAGGVAAPLIDLNGADNVTIDGRVNATGSTKDLTIVNNSTSTAAGTSTIRFIADASNNTVKYCTIKGSEMVANSTTTGSGTIFFSTGTTTGNINNTIDSNNITCAADASRPLNSIYSLGSSNTIANTGNTISNNWVYNFFCRTAASYGIYLGNYTSGWGITGNSFYETATDVGVSSYCVIYIRNTSGTGFTVNNNYIGGSSASCGGSAWTKNNTNSCWLKVISMSVGTGTASSVQGNTIRNFNWTESSNGWVGIELVNGDINVGTDVGNTIGSGSGTGSIIYTANPSSAVTLNGIQISSAGTINCSNNTIGGITTTSGNGNSVGFFGIYGNGSTATITIDNNTIGSTTTANSVDATNTIGTSQSVLGIYCNYIGGNLIVTNNTIANLTNRSQNSGWTGGMYVWGDNTTISGNTVYSLTTAEKTTNYEAFSGIVSMASTLSKVFGNTIYNLSNTNASSTEGVAGITFSASISTGTNVCNANFIHDLTVSSSAASVYGIYKLANSITISNNIVTLGAGTTTACTLYGIYETGSASYNSNIYFNTVYLGGSPHRGHIIVMRCIMQSPPIHAISATTCL